MTAYFRPSNLQAAPSSKPIAPGFVQSRRILPRALPVERPAEAVDARPIPAWKRPLDVTLVVAGLLVLWPVIALIALAVRLSGPGPVFFVQTRIGRNGRPFGMIKFRSMQVDAEARRAELLAQSDREGICFKSRKDPRITPVGRVLRRLSLDELPQIFNVLRGEMSLVGPRPALPEEVRAYPAQAMERLSVLPGITGVWQVSGRAEVGFDEMVTMDIGYARDGRLSRDLTILAATVRAVLSGRGAY
jgi:lipopolysaccharide/colanic/teichoic acid biosynthesis glycosyltransferase